MRKLTRKNLNTRRKNLGSSISRFWRIFVARFKVTSDFLISVELLIIKYFTSRKLLFIWFSISNFKRQQNETKSHKDWRNWERSKSKNFPMGKFFWFLDNFWKFFKNVIITFGVVVREWKGRMIINILMSARKRNKKKLCRVFWVGVIRSLD